jgi:predicted AlkP superfamily pyrophosphatase or phosphodiesterase
MIPRFLRRAAAGAVLILGNPFSPVAQSRPAPHPPVRLLVFFTVDQFRADYLDRYRPQFTGGLARLMTEGAFFTDAHQDHAITETAPGHASTMSGRFPRSTGITRNLAGVIDSLSPLIGSEDVGASPRRFRGTTVTDWLTAKDQRTRALSVSSKDRGAILPIGRSKQQVYWFATNGIFTTSHWYRDSLPSWVQAFNARRVPERMAGKEWSLFLPDSWYPERDSVPTERGIDRQYLFPHHIPSDTATAANWLRAYPVMDEHILNFALEGLQQLGIGQGPETDVLAISLSTTDYVGHMFGPDSREIHDQVVRLDHYLGQFLDSLYRLRDSSSIILTLTADHGATPIPEISSDRFHDPRRVAPHEFLDPIRRVLKAARADTTAVDFESGAFFVERGRLKGAKLTVAQVVDSFIKVAKAVPGVQRVDRFAELGKRDPNRDPVARRWVHMFPADMAPDVTVTLAPGSIWQYGLVATHGSPHDYDSHVPILFAGSPFKPGRYDRFVRTVDIGATLAAVLGAPPLQPLDGRPLKEALR